MLSKFALETLPGTDVEAVLQSMDDVWFRFAGGNSNSEDSDTTPFGERENLFVGDYQQGLAGLLPNCHFVVLPGGSHYAFLQKPSEMAQLITQFLQG